MKSNLLTYPPQIMNRQNQLTYCKKCENRKADLQEGLLCDITNSKADFEIDCPDFSQDSRLIEHQTADVKEMQSFKEISLDVSQETIEKLLLEQNLPAGITAGLIIGFLGALAWGIITVITHYQIGYMAIAIGAAVGFGIRIFGKGMDTIFGVLGALIAVASCVLGNFLSIIGFLANASEITYFEALSIFDFTFFPMLMKETFQPMDILFYGFALYEGYKFSFRKFTESELLNLEKY